MKWSVSFAIGLWANAILKGNVPAFFILVALLNVVLSPSALGRTVIHAGIGWLAYLLLFSSIEPTKVSRPAPFTERVVVIPRFVPTTSQEDGRSSRHGLCDVVGKSGYMGRHWLRTELELDGAPLLAWTRFERVKPHDMAYGFDFPAYLNRLGAGGLAQVDVQPTLPVDFPSLTMWQGISMRWRSYLHDRFDGNGLILGVFAADRKAVPPNVREAFERLGLAHLLAVSGYHVGLVGGIFLLLLRSQNRIIRMASAMAPVVCTTFVLACGAPYSAVRACSMMVLAWWHWIRGQSVNRWHVWAMAAVSVTYIDPLSPLLLGTQLSFVATASLMALKGRFLAFKVPLRAQMSTLAWTMPNFDWMPLLFYPANLLAGPMMLALGVGVIAGLLDPTGFGSFVAIEIARFFEFTTTEISRLHIASSSLPWCDDIGRAILWPLSSWWLIRMIDGASRRRMIRIALSVSVMIVVTSQLIRVSAFQKEELEFCALKGSHSSGFIHDGYRGRFWRTDPGDGFKLNSIARGMSLAGGFESQESMSNRRQKKWIQPPMEVWIQMRSRHERSCCSPYPLSMDSIQLEKIGQNLIDISFPLWDISNRQDGIDAVVPS